MVIIFDTNTKILLGILSMMIFIIICCSCLLSKLTMGNFCCKKRMTINDASNYNINV